jgi:hypothetical protein
MVAGVLYAAHRAIDTRNNKPRSGFLAQQRMIDTKPSIARPPVSKVAPIRVHWIIRVKGTHCVGPALFENAIESLAAFRL